MNRSKIVLLLALYFVQGLPFGFQSKTLPIFLRVRKLSLSKIGFAQALSAPWLLKFLWAPFIDKYGRSSSLGRRKAWIVPTQCCLAAVCLLASAISHTDSLVPLLSCVFVMNLLTGAAFRCTAQCCVIDSLLSSCQQPWTLQRTAWRWISSRSKSLGRGTSLRRLVSRSGCCLAAGS
jgi:hypothetical protein